MSGTHAETSTRQPTVRAEDRGGVRIITLDRPPVNAVDFDTIVGLGEIVAAAATDSSCVAVVVTGNGRAFSAGLDLKKLPAYDAARRADMIRAVNRCLLELYGLPKPTVAAINGHTFAAGFVLALACDVRLAATGSYRFGITEVGVGVPFPAVPLIVLQAELHPSTVRDLTLSGRVFESSDPMTTRFIDRFVSSDALLDAAVAEAEAAAQRLGYSAVKMQLKASALARMSRVVAEDADPLINAWF